MTTEEIKKKLKQDLVPDAIRALSELVNSESVKSTDIKLVFELARQFGVDLDEDLEKVPKSNGVLLALKDYQRSAQG